jgi:hypothetical protein
LQNDYLTTNVNTITVVTKIPIATTEKNPKGAGVPEFDAAEFETLVVL